MTMLPGALIVIFLSLILGVFLRFMSLGFSAIEAIYRTYKFPYEVIKIHTAIYKGLREENNKLARKMLFLPLTDIPRVIISIAEIHLDRKAKILAVAELLNETSGAERNKLIRALRAEGIIVKQKKIRSTEQAVTGAERIKLVRALKTEGIFVSKLRKKQPSEQPVRENSIAFELSMLRYLNNFIGNAEKFKDIFHHRFT